MLTIHAATLLRVGEHDEPLAGGAVAVRADRVATIGPLDELVGAYPGARVRRWAGTLGPALVHDAALPIADTPRERVYALLRLGVGAVVARHLTDPGLRLAAERTDLLVLETVRPAVLGPTGRADLAVFDADGACLATVLAGRLVHRRA